MGKGRWRKKEKGMKKKEREKPSFAVIEGSQTITVGGKAEEVFGGQRLEALDTR